jgi:Ulp1 family protease
MQVHAMNTYFYTKLIKGSNRFGRPAGEKRVYVDLAKKPTGAANLRI